MAGVICYLVWDNYFREETPEVKEPVTEVERIEETNNDKSEVVEQVVEDEKKTIQYNGEDPNEKMELSGTITYADVLGGRILIRVNIDQYLAEGICELDLLSGGVSVYNNTASIVNSASTATCEGFDVPVVGDIGYGEYEIVIKIKSGDREGIIKGRVEI